MLTGAALVFVFVLVLVMYYPQYPGISTLSCAVSGHRVMIDPGHGGIDPGASSREGHLEKVIVLSIGNYLKALLNQAAVYTVMSRTTDSDLADPGIRNLMERKRQDLQRRVEMAHESKVDIYVSLHCNSFPSSRWSGAQTFYFPGDEESRELAEAIQARLVEQLGPNERQVKSADYRVLRDTQMPAVMVEVGFLSNPTEARLLADPTYQQRVARAVFAGIVDYLQGYYARQKRPLRSF